jgi:hypothetical protein
MNDIYVFDASALIALFTAYRPIFRLFMEAEAGLVQLLFPAAAIGEANTYIQADEAAWTVQSGAATFAIGHIPWPRVRGRR